MEYDPMRVCQCNDECVQYGNCCEDAGQCKATGDCMAMKDCGKCMEGETCAWEQKMKKCMDASKFDGSTKGDYVWDESMCPTAAPDACMANKDCGSCMEGETCAWEQKVKKCMDASKFDGNTKGDYVWDESMCPTAAPDACMANKDCG